MTSLVLGESLDTAPLPPETVVFTTEDVVPLMNTGAGLAASIHPLLDGGRARSAPDGPPDPTAIQPTSKADVPGAFVVQLTLHGGARPGPKQKDGRWTGKGPHARGPERG